MLRISALIAVLAFLGTTTTAISAQPPGQASQRCYNAEKCASICNSKGRSQSESPKSYAVDISMISRLAPGLRRVRASLPKLFDRVYPNALYDEMPKMPLEKSEAAHWNLPAVEEDKAA
jgi:hypothetical protein